MLSTRFTSSFFAYAQQGHGQKLCWFLVTHPSRDTSIVRKNLKPYMLRSTVHSSVWHESLPFESECELTSLGLITRQNGYTSARMCVVPSAMTTHAQLSTVSKACQSFLA
jgi:hypothetical protein